MTNEEIVEKIKPHCRALTHRAFCRAVMETTGEGFQVVFKHELYNEITENFEREDFIKLMGSIVRECDRELGRIKRSIGRTRAFANKFEKELKKEALSEQS